MIIFFFADFHQNFRKFRDLVERKIALPLQEWKDTKWDFMHFSRTYETLQQQLYDVRNSVEKARLLKNKEANILVYNLFNKV